MAKRKKSSRPVETAEPDYETIDKAESRKRIRTFEDVADSDDEFHIQRDKVLLEEEPAAKRRRRLLEEEEFLEQSEEEVLDGSESEGIPEDEASEDDSEEEQEGWGTTKADTYGADAVETEEQALEEEKEARRLQKRQLQSMSVADYGFDEDDWADTTSADKPAVITETLPEPQISKDASAKERLKMLRARYPEFEPLSKELQEMSVTVRELQETGVTAKELQELGRNGTIQLNAGTAYLGALAMYFALLTSTAGEGAMALSAQELRDHEVMSLLVDCRATWQRASNLPDDEPEALSPITSEDEEEIEEISVEPVAAKSKSRKQRHADAQDAAREARIAARLARLEADDDLDNLLKSRAARATGNDYDEEVPLSKAQAEEKARKKKSLRFYTSQIAQKANKRGAAGRTAGGDDDIPHRERLRDRQARLNAEAEKRGKKNDIGDNLDGGSIDGDAEEAAQLRKQVDEDDDYYDMIAARTAKKKSDKQEYAQAQKLAAEQGGQVIEQEVVGVDGKRKVTYAIEKNKGLTPYRKKDVRNPRVKKRKKFEEKTKKLASMKPTFKGGEARGGYGGELTGIKANLVKSTRL